MQTKIKYILGAGSCSSSTNQDEAATDRQLAFLAGRPDPVRMCDSIGYPVPSTAQLTNPVQWIGSSGGPAIIDQMEPTGVYTGDSTGTYVVCLNGGKAVPTYWEGEVETEGGPAKWDKAQSMIITTGPGTVEVAKK